MTMVEIRPMAPSEAAAAAAMVIASFRKSVAPLYETEGVSEFEGYARAEAMLGRTTTGSVFFVAVRTGEIVGVAEARPPAHLAMLFVGPSDQTQGIGRQLVATVASHFLALGHEAATMTVNASPNAVPAYTRLGFSPNGEERIIKGILFLPMARPLAPG